MARAAAVELAQAHVGRLLIANRTPTRAAELAALISHKLDVPAQNIPWEEPLRLDAETEIFINATSLADADPDAELPLAADALHAGMLVVDTTINTNTRLLAAARQRGCATLDGVEILIEQAAINFRLWTGVEADRTVLREAVEEYLEL